MNSRQLDEERIFHVARGPLRTRLRVQSIWIRFVPATSLCVTESTRCCRLTRRKEIPEIAAPVPAPTADQPPSMK